MSRIARLVIPGYPHHVTQRGVRSMAVFAADADRYTYLQFLREETRRAGVTILAWCLMTNHIHLIVVPEKENSLARGIGEAHRRYTRRKNVSDGVCGYLFQGRFNSCVLDQLHLLAAARYVELNPVQAGMASSAWDYPWSSARFHVGLSEADPLVQERSLPEMTGNWLDFLQAGCDPDTTRKILQGSSTGRPVGDDQFVLQMEIRSARSFRKGNPGRPRRGGES